MICYAVIDTNVLVSALLSSNETAATVQVFEKLITGNIIPIYSAEIMKEYKEVLNRSKFRFTTETVDYLLSTIDKYGILVEPASLDIVLPDMKDLPFYEVVMEKQDDNAYLVTGNLKHFPKKPFIVTARQMIDILNGNN